MYGGVEDLADTLASVRSLKKGISQKKCNEDAIALSVKTCAFISTKKFPLILNNEIKDRRMRIMEEEIRMNIFAFIELCTDQASVPTEIFKYRTQQMCVHTSYARSLSSYNHPVPKFWN
uniref:Uncharacterized protein n=1 Tax=Panagrolaimus superbus TaxID=310955 RepID=A0A914ZBX6_9BILA